MEKHQSLIPNEKAVATTNNKQCRISKLPDVSFRFDENGDRREKPVIFSLLLKLIDIQNMQWKN